MIRRKLTLTRETIRQLDKLDAVGGSPNLSNRDFECSVYNTLCGGTCNNTCERTCREYECGTGPT